MAEALGCGLPVVTMVSMDSCCKTRATRRHAPSLFVSSSIRSNGEAGRGKPLETSARWTWSRMQRWLGPSEGSQREEALRSRFAG